jgi:hypothetical protein
MSKISLAAAKAAKQRAKRQNGDPTDGSPYLDPDEQCVRPDTTADGIEDQYLSVRGGTNLRKEAVTVKQRATTWGNVVEEFEEYIWRQWKAAKEWQEKKGISPTSHRFTESASMDRYGRTLGVDRAAYRLWGDELTTVHVVRRARPFGRNGQPQPPADHLDDLLAGNSNVYRAYRRHIKDNHGLTYARLSVLEPHRNGYAHIHDALWTHDPQNLIGETDIYPALDAHLRAVDQAQPRNHGPDAVDVRHDPERRHYESDPKGQRPTTALPREMTKYLGGLAPHDEDTERQQNVPNVLQSKQGTLRFYALLWARGIRQWRPDRQGVFKHLVKASQEWWEEDNSETTDTETFPTPRDIDTNSETQTFDIAARPVSYEPFKTEGPPT